MTAKRLTPKQRLLEAQRVARLALGRKTSWGKTIEATRLDGTMIVVTFAGWGLAPFREARYTAKEVLEMIGDR